MLNFGHTFAHAIESSLEKKSRKEKRSFKTWRSCGIGTIM